MKIMNIEPRAKSKGLRARSPRLYALSTMLLILGLVAFACFPTSYAGASSSIRGAFSFTGFAMGVGTRAMGMNGAFAAVSDDSSAAYWNPAGLTSSWCKELSFAYANLYNLDLITSNALNISAPESRGGAMAFGWSRQQYDLESWREDVFLISYAKTIVGKARKPENQNSGSPAFSLSLGATFKYLRQSSDLDITPNTDSDSSSEGSSPILCSSKGMGLDMGLLARLGAKDGRNRFSIGVAAQNIPTVVKWNSDSDLETEERIPFRYQAGCSTEPLPRLTIAFDLVGEQNVTLKEMHFGMEHWIFPVKHGLPISEKNLAIRCGIAKQLSASKRMTFAAGLGVRWAAWQIDYAYLMDNNGLGDTRNRFSISARF